MSKLSRHLLGLIDGKFLPVSSHKYALHVKRVFGTFDVNLPQLAGEKGASNLESKKKAMPLQTWSNL
jgi:hypothetical protein